MPLPAAVLGAALTPSACDVFFKVPVAVLLEYVDAVGPKPLCLFVVGIDVAPEFDRNDDRSDVLTDVFAFLQIGGGFE